MKNFSVRALAVRGLVLAAATAGISAAVAQIVDLPEAPGKELVLGACIDCHGADKIVATRRSSEEWTEVVDRMIGYGAALSSEEQAVVLAYLHTNLGSVAGSTAAPAPGASPAVPAPAPSVPAPTVPPAEPKNVNETPK